MPVWCTDTSGTNLRCCCFVAVLAELTQKAAAAEASAVYSDAKAQHEQHMAEINSTIAEVQQEVQQLSDDLR